jgi:tRNA A-37 threonylcarbamoyl transferase component Bud32
MSISPYVVGQWVRGRKFYGRDSLVNEILHGNRNWVWLLGTRRIGKTSLLKQVEHLASTTPELGYFPLFWDFQGAEDPEELRLGFGDSLLDAEERLEELGIAPEDVETDDLFRSLGQLRRRLRARGRKLLLLCDEVEELIKLNEKDPTLLRKLRRAMQSQESVRSVLASTIRLWALSDQRGDTSPFLHGFTPPLYIHNLADDEARALVRQANLPSDSRPRVGDNSVERIRTHCDNHPYLIQLLCKRYLELNDLDEATEQVANDPMVSFFFSVDFEMLSGNEQAILRIISEQESSTSASIQRRLSAESGSLGGSLHRLQHLGYIRKVDGGTFVLPNYFFNRWFRELPGESGHGSAGIRPRTASSAEETIVDDIASGAFDKRYRLIARCGKGATGEVYQAYDQLLRVTLAIKVLKPEYARHEEAMERLRREVLLSRDINHPNVVRIYHLGEFGDTKYVTMEWIDGQTLGHLIAREAPFSTERAVTVARKIVEALEAAHACNVLHRDIKPHNIMMDGDGEPHITDFGLARLVGGPGMTDHGIFVGTPDYASPEQVACQPLDARSDLYACGVLLFEMVTGRRPFIGSSAREVLQMQRSHPATDPRDHNPEVPPVLSGLILRCLEKEPEERFQTASELAGALRSVARAERSGPEAES